MINPLTCGAMGKDKENRFESILQKETDFNLSSASYRTLLSVNAVLISQVDKSILKY